MKNGNFVISLDFELFWGVKDSKPLSEYRNNLEQVHFALPKILEQFLTHQIHGTFATVGFLFFEDKMQLVAATPEILPKYKRPELSNYNNGFSDVGDNDKVDKIHFGLNLIKLIANCENQEISTHTFSHYYCLEEGATLESFEADIIAAKKVMQEHNIAMTSLVFPRNQTAPSFLKLCKSIGITSYRGNENHWLYRPKNSKDESLIRRAGRLIDSYINISGHHAFLPKAIGNNLPLDIPASRFLRPYSLKFKIFEGLRLNRIKKSMSFAAKNNLTYHLWWHPHNFGANTNENLAFLRKILTHFSMLQKKYNFQSLTMTELTKKTLDESGN